MIDENEDERRVMFDKFNGELSDFIQDYIEDNQITLGVILRVLLHNSLYALCKDQSLDDIRKGVHGVMSAFADVLTQLDKSEEKETGYDWFGFITKEIHLRHRMIRPEEDDL